jgi:hypothetical protein
MVAGELAAELGQRFGGDPAARDFREQLRAFC